MRRNKLALLWILACWPGVAAAQASDETFESEKSNPAVEAILESNPTTPSELTRAVIQLSNLNEPEEAKPFLTKLLSSQLSQTVLAGLGREFGTHVFLRLSKAGDLQPEAGQFAELVIEAADQVSRDPKRLAQLVDELKNPTPEARYAAVVDLREGKTAAVVALIEALGAADLKHRAAICDALVEMGPLAVEPLVGALETDDENLQGLVIQVLGRLKASRASVHLIGLAVASPSNQIRESARQVVRQWLGAEPSRAAAVAVFREQVQRLLEGVRPVAPDHEGLIEIWGWDAQAGHPSSKRYPNEDAGIIFASRLTQELVRLEPNSAEDNQLDLALQLEAAKIQHGFDRPLPQGPGTPYDLAQASTTQALQDLLIFCMNRHYLGAATVAAELLGDRKAPEILESADGRPSSLVQALEQGDRRLRFAALTTILKLAPKKPFPGSSRIPETLGYFLITAGTRRAVIGYPDATNGQNLASILAELGYEAEVAYNGRRLLQIATSTADVDLVLMYAGLENPDVRDVLFLLRRNPNTARVPVGLIAALDQVAEARRLAKDHQLVEAFPRPPDVEAVKQDVESLLKKAGRGLVSDEIRRQQAGVALQWLGQLAEDRHRFYDLYRQVPGIENALYLPELSREAAKCLRHFGTGTSQRALVNLASQQTFPLADRQTAAEAFRENVGEFGILLASKEILQQYDRYNQSESASRETQEVLGSILDTIEQAGQKQKSK